MPVSDYTPDATDVGAVTLSRTRDQYGNLTGTFSAATTPTNAQLAPLIVKAADTVSQKIGTEIPAALRTDAKEVVALRVAMLIETSLYADQMSNARSPYPVLKDQYETGLADLQLAIQVAEDGNGTIPNQPVSRVSYSFPEATPWLTRRM